MQRSKREVNTVNLFPGPSLQTLHSLQGILLKFKGLYVKQGQKEIRHEEKNKVR